MQFLSLFASDSLSNLATISSNVEKTWSATSDEEKKKIMDLIEQGTSTLKTVESKLNEFPAGMMPDIAQSLSLQLGTLLASLETKIKEFPTDSLVPMAQSLVDQLKEKIKEMPTESILSAADSLEKMVQDVVQNTVAKSIESGALTMSVRRKRKFDDGPNDTEEEVVYTSSKKQKTENDAVNIEI